MSDYKRLTINLANGKIGCLQEYTQTDLIHRLAELEDKIENKTLIDLPCKVGNTVYWCEENSHNKKIKVCHGKVGEITLDSQGRVWFLILVIFGRNFYTLKENFGKNIFLSEPEAEARLRELKGEV